MTAVRTTTATVALRWLTCLTVALAPVEGYLTGLHPHLAKVAPALLAVTWAFVRFRQRRAPQLHAAHALLALLAVLLLASTAVHAGGPFTVEYALRWLPFLALTVVLIDVAAREVPVRTLFVAAVAGATVAAAGALHSLLLAGALRASGPLEDPNDLAVALVVALPLLVAVLPGRPTPGMRALAVLAGTLLVTAAAATFSRGGALAFAAAVAWLLVRRVLPVRALVGTLAGTAMVVMVAARFAGPELSRALQEKTFIASTNVDTRELRWQAAARMLAEHPALGVGPGGFRTEYAAASHNAELAEQTPVAHNMFLEVAAELGLPAFCAFAGLVAVALVATERVLRTGRDRRAMVAVQAALLAVVVGATFLSEQYYLPVWLLTALAVAAELHLRREESNHARAPRDQ
jgi:putative inorganic carbon (HCO3(-)) transporter